MSIHKHNRQTTLQRYWSRLIEHKKVVCFDSVYVVTLKQEMSLKRTTPQCCRLYNLLKVNALLYRGQIFKLLRCCFHGLRPNGLGQETRLEDPLEVHAHRVTKHFLRSVTKHWQLSIMQMLVIFQPLSSNIRGDILLYCFVQEVFFRNPWDLSSYDNNKN